jgi:hypothetical protein
MRTDAQRFVLRWVIVCAALTAAVGAANAVVDPYLLFNMPRLTGFNQSKPSVERQERLIKAYQVLRAAPRSLILGTSRVGLGLDTAHPSWPATARPVYNLGIAGADPYTSFRYLQHVLSQRDLEIVILGLDFEYFFGGKKRDPAVPLAFEFYLEVDPEGRAYPDQRWRRLRDLAEGTLSLEALGDSIETVASSRRGASLDVSPSGNLSEAGFRRATDELGSAALFAQRNAYNIRTFRGRTFSPNAAKPANAAALADLQAIIDLCRSRGIQLELFMQPMHADLLETLDLVGAWPAFEMWKRDIVAVSRPKTGLDARPAARLWDFSGYDRFSMETLPARSDKHARLRWFWEPSHYSKALGDIILTRIFDGPDIGYGVVLTADKIESHLASIRDRRTSYRQNYPEGVRRVRDVYNASLK